MKLTKKNVSLAALCLVAIGAADPGCIKVSKGGAGSGTVISNPAGVDCGASCRSQFAPGTTVTLTAQASAGSTFTGWSGACSGTEITCTLGPSSGQTERVAANFDVDCGACRTYAGVCANAVACVQHCNVSGHLVQSCYRSGGDVSLAECEDYYGPNNNCEMTACERNGCESCSADSCQDTTAPCYVPSLTYCIDNCGAPTSRAEQCYQGGQISYDECEQLNGCTRVDSCDGCYSYPNVCGDAVRCVNECNIADHFVQACYRDGFDVTLPECEDHYGPNNKCEMTACEQNGCETCTGNSCNSIFGACTVDSLSYCIDNCGGRISDAEWCYEIGLISQGECEQIKTDRCSRVEACIECYQYPNLCSDVERCISECNVADHFRETCI